MPRCVELSFEFLSRVMGMRVLAGSVNPLAGTIDLLIDTPEQVTEGIAPSHLRRLMAEDYDHWLSCKTQEAVNAKLRGLVIPTGGKIEGDGP